jgi:hypothetical protein
MLQEGERMGLLNVLIGSTTITGTVATQLNNRKRLLLGLLLVVIWALSPIGGQASLRVLNIDTRPIIGNTQIQYVDKGRKSNFVAYEEGDDAILVSPVHGIFLGALAAPANIKNATMDIYRNLKFPMLEQMPGRIRPFQY